MPLEGKGKVVLISHIRFNKGGFIIRPNFEAINNKMVRRQNNQSRNKDIKGLRSGPLAVDHVYNNSGSNAESVQANKLPPVVEYNNIFDALEVLEPPPLTPAKRGRPKGSKNRTTNNNPLQN